MKGRERRDAPERPTEPATHDAAARHEHIARNLRLMRELKRALVALDAAGISAVVLKGAALHATVYRIDERAMQDVDLLVQPARLGEAADVLVGLGLQPLTSPGRPLGTRLFHARGYGHPDGTQVDLHASIAPAGRWRVDVPGLFARATPCDLDGFAGLRLSNEDLVLHLALNLAKDELAHAARCAEDVARVLTALPVDWRTLTGRAHDWGCTAALWLCLELAQRRQNAEVPASAMTDLAPGRVRAGCLEWLVDLDSARPHRLAGRGRRLGQVALAPLLSDRPADALRAGARFAGIRAADALLTRLGLDDTARLGG